MSEELFPANEPIAAEQNAIQGNAKNTGKQRSTRRKAKKVIIENLAPKGSKEEFAIEEIKKLFAEHKALLDEPIMERLRNLSAAIGSKDFVTEADSVVSAQEKFPIEVRERKKAFSSKLKEALEFEKLYGEDIQKEYEEKYSLHASETAKNFYYMEAQSYFLKFVDLNKELLNLSNRVSNYEKSGEKLDKELSAELLGESKKLKKRIANIDSSKEYSLNDAFSNVLKELDDKIVMLQAPEPDYIFSESDRAKSYKELAEKILDYNSKDEDEDEYEDGREERKVVLKDLIKITLESFKIFNDDLMPGYIAIYKELAEKTLSDYGSMDKLTMDISLDKLKAFDDNLSKTPDEKQVQAIIDGGKQVYESAISVLGLQHDSFDKALIWQGENLSSIKLFVENEVLLGKNEFLQEAKTFSKQYSAEIKLKKEQLKSFFNESLPKIISDFKLELGSLENSLVSLEASSSSNLHEKEFNGQADLLNTKIDSLMSKSRTIENSYLQEFFTNRLKDVAERLHKAKYKKEETCFNSKLQSLEKELNLFEKQYSKSFDAEQFSQAFELLKTKIAGLELESNSISNVDLKKSFAESLGNFQTQVIAVEKGKNDLATDTAAAYEKTARVILDEYLHKTEGKINSAIGENYHELCQKLHASFINFSEADPIFSKFSKSIVFEIDNLLEKSEQDLERELLETASAKIAEAMGVSVENVAFDSSNAVAQKIKDIKAEYTEKNKKAKARFIEDRRLKINNSFEGLVKVDKAIKKISRKIIEHGKTAVNNDLEKLKNDIAVLRSQKDNLAQSSGGGTIILSDLFDKFLTSADEHLARFFAKEDEQSDILDEVAAKEASELAAKEASELAAKEASELAAKEALELLNELPMRGEEAAALEKVALELKEEVSKLCDEVATLVKDIPVKDIPVEDTLVEDESARLLKLAVAAALQKEVVNRCGEVIALVGSNPTPKSVDKAEVLKEEADMLKGEMQRLKSTVNEVNDEVSGPDSAGSQHKTRIHSLIGKIEKLLDRVVSIFGTATMPVPAGASDKLPKGISGNKSSFFSHLARGRKSMGGGAESQMGENPPSSGR